MTILFKADVRTDVVDRIRITMLPESEKYLYWSWFDQIYDPQWRGQLVQAFDIGMELGRITLNPDYLRELAKANVTSVYRAVRGQGQYVEDVNLAAEFYAQGRAGDLLTGVTDAQRASVSDLTATAMRRGWSDEILARQVNRVVGLDPRQTVAVDKFRQTLVDQNVMPSFADLRADEYAKSLSWQRAQTIASTETQRAINAGQREVWKLYQEMDELPQSAQVQWVLHPTERTCGPCREVAGDVYDIDAASHPPLHPNCKCTERLVYGSGVVIQKHLESGPIHAHPGTGHNQQLHGIWSWDAGVPGTVRTGMDLNSINAVESRAFASRAQVRRYRETVARRFMDSKPPTTTDIFQAGYTARRKSKYHQGQQAGKLKKDERIARQDEARTEQGGKMFDVYTGIKIEVGGAGQPGKVQLDRLIPGKYGGKYNSDNLVVSHASANTKRKEKPYPFARPKWYTDAWIGRAETVNQQGQDLCDAFANAHGGVSGSWTEALDWAKANKSLPSGVR
jgi:hypothetical protein